MSDEKPHSSAPYPSGQANTNEPYSAGPPPVYTSPSIVAQPNNVNMVYGNQPQMPPMPPGTILLQQPGQTVVYVLPSSFREDPQQVCCPNCRANILTRTQHETGIATWLIAGGLCMFGVWCGCCLIPFCVDACKDVEHYCPNCRALVGRYKRIK